MFIRSKVGFVACIVLGGILFATKCLAQQKKNTPPINKDTTNVENQQSEELLSPIFAPSKKTTQSPNSTLTIGFLYTDTDVIYQSQLAMVQFAISEINSIPGIKPINLIKGIYKNTNDAQFVPTIDSLLKQKISVLFVVGQEQVLFRCINYVPKTLPVIYCNELSSENEVFEKPNIWKLFPPVYNQGKILAQSIDTSKYKKIALLIRDSLAHQKFSEIIQETFFQLKGKITSVVSYSNPKYNKEFAYKLYEDVFRGLPDVIITTAPISIIPSLTSFGNNVYKNLPYKKVLYLTTSYFFHDLEIYKKQPAIFENIRGISPITMHSNRIMGLTQTIIANPLTTNSTSTLGMMVKHRSTNYSLFALYDMVYLLHFLELQSSLTSVESLNNQLNRMILEKKGKKKISSEVYKNVLKFANTWKSYYFECVSGIQSFDANRYANGISYLAWKISEGTFVQLPLNITNSE